MFLAVLVRPAGCAWRAQLFPNDVLVRLNGAPLSGVNASRLVKALSNGANMQRTLVVRRSADASGQAMASVPERAAAPTPDAQKARETEVEVSLPRGRLGVTFEDMQEGGVMVVEVNDDSPVRSMVRTQRGPGHAAQLKVNRNVLCCVTPCAVCACAAVAERRAGSAQRAGTFCVRFRAYHASAYERGEHAAYACRAQKRGRTTPSCCDAPGPEDGRACPS